MKLGDFNIVYLNLDNRTDRNDAMKKQLKKFNLNAERISAVYGKGLRKKNYRQKLSNELNIPEEKLFTKQLLKRFEWASNVDKDYTF